MSRPRWSSKTSLCGCRAALGKRRDDQCTLPIAKRPPHRAGQLFDLPAALGAAKGGRDAGLVSSPIYDELGNCVAGECGRFSQARDEVLVFLPLVALIHWVVAAAVAVAELMVTSEAAGQK